MNGCDAGREGELIFAYIYEQAKADEAGAAAVGELDDREAIRDGFEALRDGDGDGEPGGRRPLPLGGRLAGRHERHPRRHRPGRALGGVVSLGRVQTPTLALIVRRDLEIDAFVPETYFQVDARFQLDGARSYTGRWF